MSQHMELSGYTTVDPGRKREKAFSISGSHLGRCWLLNGKEDSCQQEGVGARRQISQHNSQEENKNKRSVSYGGSLC